jgi:glycosyltransferase involved in cell wall biosynthesis
MSPETPQRSETGPGRGPADGVAPLLSVVMPVYDEIRTLPLILERVLAVPLDKEVVVVDDGSRDGSREFLEGLARRGDPRLRILFHERNQGKTAAIVTGVAATRGHIVVFQDADLEYDPAELPRLIAPIVDGDADVVYGSRFTGSPRRVLLFWHTVGNRLLTLLSNAFTNLNLTDMETCYKAFRAEVIRRIPLRSRGFGLEPEITASVARMGCRIYEVPISYHGRDYWEGKKIGWRDGLHAFFVIVRSRFRPSVAAGDAGFLTLHRVERLSRYNAFLWERMAPWIGRRVLEVGAGTGIITRRLADCERVVATDTRPEYLALLRNAFERVPHVEVRSLVLGERTADLPEGDFDTVVCCNVLEHVEDDARALRQLHDALAAGGRLVLVVPLLARLYGSIDRALGHYRRYEPDELRAKLEAVGFEVEALRPFNVIGILGWYLNSVWLKRRAVPGVQARINDWLVPWLRVEGRFQPRVGMSSLVVARRRGA